jgi:glycosyltransferase involved in cell wall biosynthesis
MVTSDRRIVIAIPCLLRGGTEQQSLHLARALRGFADQISVCCYFEFDPSVVSEFENSGVTVHKLGLNRAMGSWRVTASLRQTFRSLRPTIVHVQYMAPGFLAVLAARLARVPKVLATVHQPATPYGRKAKCLLRTAARMCDRFICVSQTAERSWFGSSSLYEAQKTEDGRRKTEWQRHVTIPNAVDLDRIDLIGKTVDSQKLRMELQLDGGPIIGTVSRLRREKGVDILLDAFALVNKQISSARLIVVGHGPDYEMLRARSSELGTGARRVTWTGQKRWEEAIALMNLMDVVVVPSRFEGFGLTAAEAMACEKPVVASNVDGLAEVIGDNGSGVLVPPEDPQALASALLELSGSPDRRAQIGKAARTRIDRLYSMDVFRNRTLRLYCEVLRCHRDRYCPTPDRQPCTEPVDC